VPDRAQPIEPGICPACGGCHDDLHLRRPGAERFETAGKPSARKAAPSVGRMQRMPEAGIRPDQVPQIIEAFRTLSGQN
jgi:hypothetical protein